MSGSIDGLMDPLERRQGSDREGGGLRVPGNGFAEGLRADARDFDQEQMCPRMLRRHNKQLSLAGGAAALPKEISSRVRATDVPS
jgi:hypothetical protein